MSTNLMGILIALFFFGLVVGYVLYVIIPTDQDTTIYKDYRIDNHVFTVHLHRDGDRDVQIKVCEWHLPPRNRWQYTTQFFKIKCYDEKYWRPCLTQLNLENFIIEFLEEIIATEAEEERLDKEWEEFCDNLDS